MDLAAQTPPTHGAARPWSAELVAVAAEEDGRGIGRVRLHIKDATAASLEAFAEEAIEAGMLIHTDGWEGYAGLQSNSYRRERLRCYAASANPPASSYRGFIALPRC